MKKTIAVASAMFIAFGVHAAEENLAPPPMPKNVKPQKRLPADYKPQVTVRQGKTKRYEEYRIKGQLVKVKVIPKRGKGYEIHNDEEWVESPVRHDLDTQNTPRWKIFSW